MDDPLTQAVKADGTAQPHLFKKGEPCPMDYPPPPGGIRNPRSFSSAVMRCPDFPFTIPLVPALGLTRQEHTEPHDDYTLKGFRWVTPFPTEEGTDLVLMHGVTSTHLIS